MNLKVDDLFGFQYSIEVIYAAYEPQTYQLIAQKRTTFETYQLNLKNS